MIFLWMLLSNVGFANCYEKSPFVSEEAWKKAQPYLFPVNHPLKAVLDKIFNKDRVISSHQSMKKAGFKFNLPRGNRRVTVAKHPKIKGLLIKTYLDTQNTDNNELKAWLQRIEGARYIQTSIDKHNYNHILKTPKKWIYPLPPLPLQEGLFRKNFILVVENMNIVSQENNTFKYRHFMSREKMDALYVILTENLLIDSIYLDNIPFSKDGKIAFVDTEHYLTTKQPLKLHRLTKYFSPIMQDYWNHLIHNGVYN